MISHYAKHLGKCFLSLPSLLLVSACSSTDSTPGTEVHAHVTHLPPAATVTETATPGKQFTNNNGVTIELTSAYLTLSEMDLRTSCSPATPFARLIDAIYEFVLPVANAHTESTPKKLGTPQIVDLLNPDSEELEFGHFSPPPGSYCGVTVHMHPADTDTVNLPATLSMDGLVLHLSGNYDNGGGATGFTVEISLELEHADVAFPADIELSATNLTDEIHLNIEYHTWFDNIVMTNLAALDPAEVAQLGENITASIKHE